MPLDKDQKLRGNTAEFFCARRTKIKVFSYFLP